MDLIKKIIREELEKVLANLNENDFSPVVKPENRVLNPKNNIIHDYETGRAFGNNTLSEDIVGLNRYNLVEYLPKNTNEESWSFEFETVYKTILIVDINRTMVNNRSFWSIKFGQLYKEQQMPHLIAELEGIEGYDRFLNEVNSKIAPKIDPSKY